MFFKAPLLQAEMAVLAELTGYPGGIYDSAMALL